MQSPRPLAGPGFALLHRDQLHRDREYQSVVARLRGFRARVTRSRGRRAPQRSRSNGQGAGVQVDALDLDLPWAAVASGNRGWPPARQPCPGHRAVGLGQEHAAAGDRRAVAVRPRPIRVGEGHALFLPQRPYLPLGTLADAIAYPELDHQPGAASWSGVARGRPVLSGRPARRRGQLGVAPSSGGEQQRLGFCRILPGAAENRVSSTRRPRRSTRRPRHRCTGCCARPIGTRRSQRRPPRHLEALPRGDRRSRPATASARPPLATSKDFRGSAYIRMSFPRHPGEGRDPPISFRDAEEWVPAFAGMTFITERPADERRRSGESRRPRTPTRTTTFSPRRLEKLPPCAAMGIEPYPVSFARTG